MSGTNGKCIEPKQEPEFWRRRRLIRESTLTAQQRLLLFVLADYSGTSDTCWPAASSIADDMGLKERQVRSLLSELKAIGVITCVRRGMGRSNLTRVDWDRIPSRQDLQPTAHQDLQQSAGQDMQSTAGQEAQTCNPLQVKTCTGLHARPAEDCRSRPAAGCMETSKGNIKGTPTPGGGWGDLGILREEFKSPKAVHARYRKAIELGLMKDTPEDEIRFMRLGAYVAEQCDRSDNRQAYSPDRLFLRLAERRDFRGTKDHERKACDAIKSIKSRAAQTADTTNRNGHTHDSGVLNAT